MNRIKVNSWIKALRLFLVVALLSCVCLLAVACKHEHTYAQEVTKEPTCAEVGEMTHKCSKCNNSYVEVLPKTEHDYLYISTDGQHWQICSNCSAVTTPEAHNYTDVKSSTPATCQSTGLAIKACVCGDTINETLEMTAHSFTVVEKNANKHWIKCANCSATSNEEDHDFGSPELIAASTCTQQGSRKLSCSCGEIKTESLPLADHNYTKIVALDDKNHWTVCAVCNKAKPNQTVMPHNLSVSIADADCVKKGAKTTACADCDYTVTEEIDALGHDLDTSKFSSASTGSGHYYKCNRCNKDIVEPHQFVDCDCPEENVGNRAPTCYREGHRAEKCEICEKVYCRKVGKTDDHNLDPTVWLHNGTHHWHACTNGDGKYTCDYQGDMAQHKWVELIIPATCAQSGTRKMACECGEVQSTKIIPAVGHKYVTIETITEATCTSEGTVVQRCENCDDEIEVTVPQTKHDLSEYVSTISGHRNKCANCDFVQTYESNHTWLRVTIKEPTCSEEGSTENTCEFCNFSYTQTTTKDHDYRVVDGSSVAPTCKDDGSHSERCSVCGAVKNVVDPKLTTHTVKEYPAKDMTATQPGNRHYWQCTVCGRYFSGHGCDTELFEEDIFFYPPTVSDVDNIAILIALGNSLQDSVATNDYYKITATVSAIDYLNNVLLLSDDTEAIYASLVARENIYTIMDKDVLIIKGKLIKVGNEVTLVDCQIVSIECDDNEIHSLFINVINDSRDQDLYLNLLATVVEFDNDWYEANTNNYNCLMTGCTVVFHNYIYDAVLQKVIINGKPYTMTSRTLEITVGYEDIYAEFVFDDDNYCSVTLREIDTNNNQGEAIIADEYISYTYTNGGYNDLGHLHKNSHLTFTSENANITGINITYDLVWLNRENNDKALENVIRVIRENGFKVEYEQGDLSKIGQVKVTIPLSEACTVLEYFADVHQAQVTEIIILYQTNNV